MLALPVSAGRSCSAVPAGRLRLTVERGLLLADDAFNKASLSRKLPKARGFPAVAEHSWKPFDVIR